MKQWEYYVFDEDWDAEDRELMNVCNTLVTQVGNWSLLTGRARSEMMDRFVGSCLSAKKQKTDNNEQHLSPNETKS